MIGLLRKYWKALVAAVGLAVVAVLTVGAYRRRAVSLADAIAAEKAISKIAELRSRRAELERADERDELRIATIDFQIDAYKETIAKVRKRADVPPEELLEEFARLGY